MLLYTIIFIVTLHSTAVDIVSSKSWYSVNGQASCNSCCLPVEHLEMEDDTPPPCSSVNVELTKKQNAQVRLAKPKYKQYRKKLLNGKRPNVTVVTFDDSDQINSILERFGDLFKDKRPRKLPKPSSDQPYIKTEPIQNDEGDDGYRAPLWNPIPTPKPGSYRSWTYTYSSRTHPITYTGTSNSKYRTQTVVGKRKRRDATSTKQIEVCPRRESWQDLNLALNAKGKLVQIVQLPNNQKQWVLEDVCSKKTSPILPNVSCQNRARTITAVVVPLSGSKGSTEIQVQEIQVHCCTAYYTIP
ncbi:uncharacterized protein [Antedon mediterranea]|uniref:uncharacterized protein n=1 Tax=Antedon mediterranea TaxID=105859 RepID=UPI003AF51B01